MSTRSEDRHQHHPVWEVRNGRITEVGVISKNNVPFLNLSVIGTQEWSNKRPELPHHHLAFNVGNHRETVALLADAWGHGGAKQHRIHFFTGVTECVFNQVNSHTVDIDTLKRLLVGLNNRCSHISSPRLNRLDEQVAHRIYGG